MEISISRNLAADSNIVLFVDENAKIIPGNEDIAKIAKDHLIKAKNRFTGKAGEFLHISLADSKYEGIILAGIGKESDVTNLSLQNLGGQIASFANNAKLGSISISLNAAIGKISAIDTNANIAYGAHLKSYRFDKYRTKDDNYKKPTLKKFVIANSNKDEVEEAFTILAKIADGVFLTRNLVSEPPNVLYPASFATQCEELEEMGVKVKVLDVEKMQKLSMGSLLGVGQGSHNDSRLVVMKWNGLGKDSKDAPIAFVGKGVTFDTGGISLKPAAGMEDMKYDMAGAGTVTGLMKALAGRKARVNAVGVIGLVENMPGGNAQRPSDVVKSMSGQTIEVLNTDAEGRLVLADALWYTQDKFKPQFMVNLATLTGAIVITLGCAMAGLFSNNDELSERLLSAGKKVGEELWRLPLGEYYDKQINSDIADMRNIGEGREAGSITAAQFLQRFVNGTPWAHLDIAGMAWAKKDLDICPKGASGYGVRLLDQLVKDYYEQ